MKKSIVFFGSGYYTIPVVKKLLEHGLDLVITTEKNTELPLLKFCIENKIKVIMTQNRSDLINHQSSIVNHDLAVLASFGAIIPKKIIEIFPLGIFNIHPSLLPKHKGPSPVQFTILCGNKQAGVTIIKLDDKVDHGPILSQKAVELFGNETFQELTKKLFLTGSEMIQEIIQKIENGLQTEETPQDEKHESWTKKILKTDGKIDIGNPPEPKELDQKIRAFYPWPGVYLTASINGKPKIIKLLPQNIIQVEGKNPMTHKDFINGYSEGKNILEKLKLI